ncbi:MAG: hypothetical protein SWH61_09160 [Thermodesulfobacteriota bacterium]|nr:hypothetical protein [Thermodesulfobacteriota bacterium]
MKTAQHLKTIPLILLAAILLLAPAAFGEMEVNENGDVNVTGDLNVTGNLTANGEDMNYVSYCRATLGGNNQDYDENTVTAFDWQDVEGNTHNEMDLAADTWTAPKDGLYQVNLQTRWSVGGDQDWCWMGIRKNGNGIRFGYLNSNGSGHESLGISTIIKLATGEVLTFEFKNTDNQGNINGMGFNTWLEIYRLGNAP